MALDMSSLTTRSECDEALDSLAAELDGYQVRDTNLEFSDRRADRSQATTAAKLAGAEAEIAAYTAILAQPNLPAEMRRQNESKLRKATDRRDNLNDQSGGRSGAARLLADVDAEQVAAQVTVLTNAINQVTAHKATLPN